MTAKLAFGLALSFLLLSLLLAVVPLTPAHAQQFPGDTDSIGSFQNPEGLVPCGDAGEEPCQFCHLAALAQDLINFFVFITAFIATILFVYAGFLYITAGGDPAALKKAHGIFGKVIIGFVVVLIAWFVVDIIMKGLLDEGDEGEFGVWNQIECVSQPSEISDVREPVSERGRGFEVVPPTTGTIAGFSTDPGIQDQEQHVSQELDRFLRCMRQELPAGVGRISSISDSLIVSDQKDFGQCSFGGCQHKARSCHYGGRNCVGSSYAVDFGDEQNLDAFSSAAKSCNADAKVLNEGDHIHISIGEVNGCGCN